MGRWAMKAPIAQCPNALQSDLMLTDIMTQRFVKHSQIHYVPYHIQCGCCNTGMLMLQVMIAELMQHWGAEGLDSHLKSLQTVYKRRAQLMHNSAQQV